MNALPNTREGVASFDLSRVTIARRGHDPPLSNGTLVQCVYSHVSLYERLPGIDGYHSRSGVLSLRMGDAGQGLIVDQRYHVEPLELLRARVHKIDLVNGSRIEGAIQNLWYLIAFAKGLFWTRFDWVKLA